MSGEQHNGADADLDAEDGPHYEFREEPIQLIEFKGNNFKLNPEALDMLEAIREEIIVVSVVGKARTGKSYLMNLLLDIAGKGKGVSLVVTLVQSRLEDRILHKGDLDLGQLSEVTQQEADNLHRQRRHLQHRSEHEDLRLANFRSGGAHQLTLRLQYYCQHRRAWHIRTVLGSAPF